MRTLPPLSAAALRLCCLLPLLQTALLASLTLDTSEQDAQCLQARCITRVAGATARADVAASLAGAALCRAECAAQSLRRAARARAELKAQRGGAARAAQPWRRSSLAAASPENNSMSRITFATLIEARCACGMIVVANHDGAHPAGTPAHDGLSLWTVCAAADALSSHCERMLRCARARGHTRHGGRSNTDISIKSPPTRCPRRQRGASTPRPPPLSDPPAARRSARAPPP